MGHGYASCCEICDSTGPAWQIVRQGDAVVSWACRLHLSTVCNRLQRDFEVTRLEVTHYPKAVEVAGINRMIRDGMGAD